jgi:hypothetical protein
LKSYQEADMAGRVRIAALCAAFLFALAATASAQCTVAAIQWLEL